MRDHFQNKDYCNVINSKFLLDNVKESGFFEGYASVFDKCDRQGDIIVPGAFIDCTKVKLLWQHDYSCPIGKILNMHEDKKGLYIKAKLLLDIEQARVAYSLLKENIIDSLSIGYSVIEYDLDAVQNTRLLKRVKLWEVSLVTFPANADAQVLNVKNDSKINDDATEDFLLTLNRAISNIKI